MRCGDVSLLERFACARLCLFLGEQGGVLRDLCLQEVRLLPWIQLVRTHAVISKYCCSCSAVSVSDALSVSVSHYRTPGASPFCFLHSICYRVLVLEYGGPLYLDYHSCSTPIFAMTFFCPGTLPAVPHCLFRNQRLVSCLDLES